MKALVICCNVTLVCFSASLRSLSFMLVFLIHISAEIFWIVV